MVTTAAANTQGRLRTEALLACDRCDFSGAFLGTQYLHSHIRDFPDTVTDRTVDALVHILESERFDRQKQVFFLYSQAAGALIHLAAEAPSSQSERIIARLLDMTARARGKRLRALSQALCRLPVSLPELESPGPATSSDSLIPLDVSLDTLTSHLFWGPLHRACWQGRSLLLFDRRDTVRGVVKFAISLENIRALRQETWWMNRLTHENPDGTCGVLLPSPLQINGYFLFKIPHDLPPGRDNRVRDNICIAFTPCPGYYEYPNERIETWPEERLLSVFRKNAAFLGRIARQGILHTALIPLFHNRTQQGRRNDNGAYLWEHGGRLDQWLDSCRFPNFAASGPRDFEHMVLARDSRHLGHCIGEHLLSFVLVIGSVFRNKDPLRRGIDGNGQPCDARDLFCPALFSRLLENVTRAYFNSMVGDPWPETDYFSFSDLVDKLISAMGRDIHMEEVLRIRDQERMSDTEFSTFLRERGVTAAHRRGDKDIVSNSGPHLGGFNQPICVPELIDCLFRFSARCVAGCFLNEKGSESVTAPSACHPDESPCCN